MSELARLQQVQELDTRIFALREQVENHPLGEEVAALREEEEACARALGEAESSLEESGKKQKRLETEVQGVDEKLAREEEKLFGGRVTNPKELRGLQAEVRSLKRKKDELETELLEEMERQDEIRFRVEGLRARRNELLADIEEKEGTLRAELEKLQGELGELEREREELAGSLEDELLELYEKLLAGKQNLAVVKVIEGICQGCRVELPGKEYDRFLRSEGIFRCPNCGRILVRQDGS
ncbi:MAG: hypothetical protein H5T73_09535 [Actinobacteria bacterium]|nr:hypothetical protein [Actinomycetota bacterium]